jgi:hypothetical protein
MTDGGTNSNAYASVGIIKPAGVVLSCLPPGAARDAIIDRINPAKTEATAPLCRFAESSGPPERKRMPGG